MKKKHKESVVLLIINMIINKTKVAVDESKATSADA